MTWTKSYFGVQHLAGHRLLENRTYQVTLEIYAACASWYVLALRGDHPFTPIREEDAPTPELAREAAERAFLLIVGEKVGNP